MWIKQKNEVNRNLKIDETFLRINSDGTKDRLRFVQYPDQSDLLVHEIKVRDTGRFVEFIGKNEWECMYAGSKIMTISEAREEYPFFKSALSFKKIFNTLKAIINESRIQ